MRNKIVKQLRKEAQARTEGKPNVCYDNIYHGLHGLDGVTTILGDCTKKSLKNLKRAYANR